MKLLHTFQRHPPFFSLLFRQFHNKTPQFSYFFAFVRALSLSAFFLGAKAREDVLPGRVLSLSRVLSRVVPRNAFLRAASRAKRGVVMFKRLFGVTSSSSGKNGNVARGSGGGGGDGLGGGTTASGRVAFDAVDKLKDVRRARERFLFSSSGARDRARIVARANLLFFALPVFSLRSRL